MKKKVKKENQESKVKREAWQSLLQDNLWSRKKASEEAALILMKLGYSQEVAVKHTQPSAWEE